ncbi:hypothetical protein G7085_19780 [Tessaracoccus sp. HDW20]|uniref:hypothetical protein n=1 Tax=Tessaracoccus coleopterorum TaxID=2714950 RepID=UPI0018D3ADE0|nr:hypothetical protein [Tessaracoccus coleopterorum]NHB86019.1 hypothetical protein [Tessaracoccus coleopterorum]
MARPAPRGLGGDADSRAGGPARIPDGLADGRRDRVSGFEERLAAAAAGDLVQVDLQLRALSALIVGPFAAVTPIMLLSAFWPEPRSEQVEGDPVPTY